MIASTWSSLHAQCRALGLRLLLGIVPEVVPGQQRRSRLGIVTILDPHGERIASVDVARFDGRLDRVAFELGPVVEDWRRQVGRSEA